MNRIKRIIHFVPGFDHGGIESRLLDWIDVLDLNEYQIDIVVCTEIKQNNLAQIISAKGCNFIEIANMTPKKFLKFHLDLNKIFKSKKYDIAHCHNPVYGYFFLRYAQKYKVPVRIMHSRTNQLDKDSSMKILRNYLKDNVQKFSNVNLACSRSAGEWVFKDNNFTVLNNGIIIKKFAFSKHIRDKIRNELNIPKDTLVLGTVGRLTPVKNHTFLLKTLKIIIQENNNKKILLVIIGEGPERDKLEKYINEQSLESYVLLLGKKENINEYYNAMDIFLFPSLYEGFGTVAVEAQANGLPVIISSGVPDDVKVSNYIVKIKDYKVSDWIYQIHNFVSLGRNINGVYDVREKGYDNLDTVKVLKSIYDNDMDELKDE